MPILDPPTTKYGKVNVEYDCCQKKGRIPYCYAVANNDSNGGKLVCRSCRMKAQNGNADFQAKQKAGMVEKYGAEHALQSEEIKQKIRDTMQERYGVEWANRHVGGR